MQCIEVREDDLTAELLRSVFDIYAQAFGANAAIRSSRDRADSELVEYAKRFGQWRFGGRGAHKLWVRPRIVPRVGTVYRFEVEGGSTPEDIGRQEDFAREVRALLASRNVAIHG
jgi:hypothetical protein